LISRHVVHHDHILPYQPCTSNASSWHYHTDFTSSTTQPEFLTPQEITTPTPTSNPTSIDPILTENDISLPSPTPSSPNIIPNQSLTTTQNLPITSNHRPVRVKHTPSYLQDYVCTHSSASSTPSSKGILYPIFDIHSYDNLSPSHHAYTLSITHHSEPNSYMEASNDTKWIQAMDLELEVLTKTGTWSIVDLPPNIKPIGCRWVYKVKYKPDGSVERYKARLVTKGYNQIEG
jgi:hypothetical protein